MLISTPYSLTKNMFQAWDDDISRLKKGEWAVMKDGDTAFLIPSFGHQLKEYFRKYPDTGLFTCYASRCHYRIQMYDDKLMDSDSISAHKLQAEFIKQKYQGKIIDINRRVAGHLLAIKKETWYQVREDLRMRVLKKDKKILGFDTQLCYAILAVGMKIRLMKGIYVFHYLRLNEGMNNKKHLL